MIFLEFTVEGCCDAVKGSKEVVEDVAKPQEGVLLAIVVWLFQVLNCVTGANRDLQTSWSDYVSKVVNCVREKNEISLFRCDLYTLQ